MLASCGINTNYWLLLLFFFDCYIFLFQLQIIALPFFFISCAFLKMRSDLLVCNSSLSPLEALVNLLHGPYNIYSTKRRKHQVEMEFICLQYQKWLSCFIKIIKYNNVEKNIYEILNRITKNFIFYCILVTSITWIFK